MKVANTKYKCPWIWHGRPLSHEWHSIFILPIYSFWCCVIFFNINNNDDDRKNKFSIIFFLCGGVKYNLSTIAWTVNFVTLMNHLTDDLICEVLIEMIDRAKMYYRHNIFQMDSIICSAQSIMNSLFLRSQAVTIAIDILHNFCFKSR